MRSPSTTMTAGDSTSPPTMSTQRAARKMIGASGRVHIFVHVVAHGVGSDTRSRYAAPLSTTLGWCHTSTGNDTVTSEYTRWSRFARVVGHLVERELVAVRDRLLEPREARVVERRASRPSSSQAAWRSARAPWEGTTSPRTARDPRTRSAATCQPSGPTPPRFALVVVDPVVGHLVQVPAQDLLVVERERRRPRATRA